MTTTMNWLSPRREFTVGHDWSHYFVVSRRLGRFFWNVTKKCCNAINHWRLAGNREACELLVWCQVLTTTSGNTFKQTFADYNIICRVINHCNIYQSKNTWSTESPAESQSVKSWCHIDKFLQSQGSTCTQTTVYLLIWLVCMLMHTDFRGLHHTVSVVQMSSVIELAHLHGWHNLLTCLPLHSARPVITFLSAQHCCPVASTKSHCLVTCSHEQHMQGNKFILLVKPISVNNFTQK